MTASSLRTVQTVEPSGPLNNLVGHSPAMQRMFEHIARVARTRLTVLITGETGTGKELVARAVHELSDRAAAPFVAVNCSAIPETLIEAELFGFERGSFTGAVASRRGLIEEASGGTLFLDEVSALTPQVQVRLLRVLEDRQVRKLGSSRSIPVDFRLIAATNEDLERKVEDGAFRGDLYFRLNVFPISVPSLRDRLEDIPLLAEHFRRSFARENDIVPPPFSSIFVERLAGMRWEGNVRQLKHFVERAIVVRLDDPDVRCVEPLQCAPCESPILARAVEESWTLEELDVEYIRQVLRKTGGHRGRAAAVLGIDRRTLYRKLRSLSTVLWPAAAAAVEAVPLFAGLN